MRVLGIDPGLRNMGWGIVDGDKNFALSDLVIKIGSILSVMNWGVKSDAPIHRNARHCCEERSGAAICPPIIL